MLLSYIEIDDGCPIEEFDFRPTTAKEVCEILKHAQFISDFHNVEIEAKFDEIEITESWKTFRYSEDDDFQQHRIWTLKF